MKPISNIEIVGDEIEVRFEDGEFVHGILTEAERAAINDLINQIVDDLARRTHTEHE